jgi:hypothetical protein
MKSRWCRCLRGIHRHSPPTDTPIKYGPSLDCGSAAAASSALWALRLPLGSHPLHGVTALGLGAARPPGGRPPSGLAAGAETAPSGSYDGCPTVAQPPRRGVRRGCPSKRFSPFLTFASAGRARLPVGPLAGPRLDAAGFASCCGPGACTLPWRARPRASTPRSPEHRRAATKVAWPLLRPDCHRPVTVSFQDAPGVSNGCPTSAVPGLASNSAFRLLVGSVRVSFEHRSLIER